MRKILLILIICLCCIPAVMATDLLDYSSNVTFYHNITAGMGTQSDYQVKFILSNASGVSGYYSPDNVVFTNGTTRPDWYDVNATDGSGTPLPFWIENNTQTAYNATAWVKVPSIAVGNTSTGKWYYGNASQSVSTMNGLNTFPYFTDWLGSGLNSTQESVVFGSGTTTVSGGYLQLSSATNVEVGSKTAYSYNYTFRARTNTSAEGSIWLEGFGDPGLNCFSGLMYTDTYARSWAMNGTNASRSQSFASTTLNVFDVSRYPRSTNFSYNNVPAATLGSSPNTLNGTAWAGGTRVIYQDWVFIRKSVYPDPTTSLYSTASTELPTEPLVASFTQSPNPSSVSQLVQFNDTSTGAPTTWNWTIEGVGVTNTTQNMTYIFNTAGTYYIDLNVTNSTGSFSNITMAHTVVNASGFTPQDVWMEGQYTQMFSVTDSSTGLPIAGVLIDDLSGQQNTTIANGTGWITEGFGSYAILFTATGYNPKQATYVFDQDESHDVQLTPASSSTVSKSTWYTPHQVQFIAVDSNYKKLPDVTIEATAIANTFPAGTDWLVSMYGMDADAANQIMNGTLVMSGDTGTDGAMVFTMLSSIQYNVTLTEPTTGVTTFTKIYPKDPSYTVRMVGVASAANNTYTDMGYNTTLWVSEPNASYITLNLNYSDISGRTSLVEYFVVNKSNGTTINYQTATNPGTSTVKLNYTVPNIKFIQWSWYYNAIRTV